MSGWKIILWVAVVAVVLWFLYLVRLILLPFVLGFIIAVLLEPVVKKMRLKGVPRGRAVGLVFTSFFVLVIAIGIASVPLLTGQVLQFSSQATKITENLSNESFKRNYFVRWNPARRASESMQVSPVDTALGQLRPTLERFGLPTTSTSIVKTYIEPRRKEITSVISGFFTGFLGLITGIGSQLLILPLTPFVALLLLLDLDRLRENFPRWIPQPIRGPLMSVITEVGDVFLAYMRGMTLSWSLYTGILAILLTLVGTPYGALLSLLFGALYLIPFIGGIINYITLFLVVGLSGTTSNWFMSTNSPWTFALLPVGVLFVMTYAWDSLAHPQLVGKSVGLNPLVSMFVVFAGGALFGLIGMVMAFPVGGAVKVILERLLRVTSTNSSDIIGLPSVPRRHRTEF